MVTGFVALFGFWLKENYSKSTRTIDIVVTDCLEIVEEVIRIASTHWSGRYDEPNEVPHLIAGHILELSETILFLTDKFPSEEKLFKSRIHQIHRAATGGDFGVIGRDVEFTRISDIRVNAARLKRSLRSLQSKKFSPL